MSQDPLHGQTLANILQVLVDAYGWARLGEMVPVRCFNHEPSMASSLKFLRRTPWARAQVEQLFLALKRDQPKPLVFNKQRAAKSDRS